MKLLKYGLPLLVVAIIAIALISPGKQKNSSIVQTNESQDIEASDISKISPQEFDRLLSSGEYTVIDIRTPEEIAEGKITNDALEINFYDENFKQQIRELNPDDKYLVYCRSGNRSGQSLEIFKELGFENVKELDSGIVAWESYQSSRNESESNAVDIAFGQTIDIEIQGQNHVRPGTTDYTAHNSNPPTSGDHYAQAPGWGVYKKEMSDLSAVHALEHGGIWISYQGSLDDESVKELKKIANSNAGAVIMSPRDENPAPIAIASWGKLMYLETPDTAIIKNFIDANKNNTHEPFAR